MNNWNKKIEEIDKEYNEMLDKYQNELEKLNRKLQVSIFNFNSITTSTNTFRWELRIEIRKLYKFLIAFGNVGAPISIFEFARENMKAETEIHFDNVNGNHEKKSYKSKLAEEAAFMIFSPPLLRGAILGKNIVSGIINNKESKEEYLTLEVEKKTAENEWKEQIQKCKDKIKFYNTAYEIAQRYIETITTVRDCIAETIIPELGGIEAFISADAINNCIINQSDPNEAVPVSIIEYKDTAYNNHYIFVKNAFEFYRMISDFFTKEIVGNMLDGNTKYVQFDVQVRKIINTATSLKQLSQFGGEQQ